MGFYCELDVGQEQAEEQHVMVAIRMKRVLDVEWKRSSACVWNEKLGRWGHSLSLSIAGFLDWDLPRA